MFKIDLHTHSVASPDGGLREADYRRMLDSGGLDFIAITDHNGVEFANNMRKVLGDKIIIGEEIKAREGELIGLFLSERVPDGLSVRETAQTIRAQGGLVYVPHPFESVRSGISLRTLDNITELVDIVEGYNGRAFFQNNSLQALAWADKHGACVAASSDAHGYAGWGRTYSIITEEPARENLTSLLTQAQYRAGTVGVRGVLYPKLNRLKKKVGRA